MDQVPCVSIGMPIYNGEQFLAETIESILTQTFEDFELIISDNASTDITKTICWTYMAKDSRIRYFRNETNLGAAKNYNRVFELASGKYFKWAAADDLCAPTYLEKCVTILETQPEAVLSYPQTTIIDEHSEAIRQYHDDLDLRIPNVRDRFRQAISAIAECNAVFGVIRSDVLRKTSLIGNYLASDKVLLVELSLFGQFYKLPEYLFFRREHPQASSCNKSIESQQEFFDPKTRGGVSLYLWRHHLQYLAAIQRASLKPIEAAMLAGIVLRCGLQVRQKLIQELTYAFRQIVRNQKSE